MTWNAYAFIDSDNALGAGHVGWGFSLNDGGTYYFGSTQNYWNGNPINTVFVPPGGNTDWWAKTGSEREMLAAMRARSYNAYRVVDVPSPDPIAARHIADESKNWGFTGIGNNCLDHAYRVLEAFKTPGMPWPLTHPFPNQWFGDFPGHEFNL